MIFQIYTTNLGVKNVVPIPFESGMYDVSFIRCDIGVSGMPAGVYQAIIIRSDRIPFKTVPYLPYTPIPRSFQNVAGLLVDVRNDNISNTQNTGFSNTEETYNYNGVFLDGYIDFSFFSSGVTNGGVAVYFFPRQPPATTSSILLTLDIKPSSQIIGIGRQMNSPVLYQCIFWAISNVVTSTSGSTFIGIFGKCRIRILRLDSLSSVVIREGYKLTSPQIENTASNDGIIFFSNTDFSTAYYSDNLTFIINSSGQVNFNLTRLDNLTIGLANGVLITFTVEPI
jgi:hypothetical protein